ncbi:hypothetical protein N1851_026456 [Merluccius polli]|uniref:Uncharacterized protein n=1 Tax=Merluccius polli TaxID=89951 RepID=A0AA47NV67_MERPO|nr:hypothetical protein N1851_026456 [Merluccius polli]
MQVLSKKEHGRCETQLTSQLTNHDMPLASQSNTTLTTHHPTDQGCLIFPGPPPALLAPSPMWGAGGGGREGQRGTPPGLADIRLRPSFSGLGQNLLPPRPPRTGQQAPPSTANQSKPCHSPCRNPAAANQLAEFQLRGGGARQGSDRQAYLTDPFCIPLDGPPLPTSGGRRQTTGGELRRRGQQSAKHTDSWVT